MCKEIFRLLLDTHFCALILTHGIYWISLIRHELKDLGEKEIFRCEGRYRCNKDADDDF